MASDWKKYIIDGAHNYATQSGAGTIDPDDRTIVYVTTTGADAIELSDGVSGQYILLVMDVDGGDATLLGSSNLKSYTSVTMDDVGDWVCFQFDGRNWVVIANRGCTLNSS